MVDDEPAVRRLIVAWLKAADLDVIEAENGAQAIALVSQNAPDVIVMDVMLPDMTGFAVSERIRARPGFRSIPVIGLTGLDMRIDVAHEGGFSDLLHKPVDRDTLVYAVQRELRLRDNWEMSRRAASRSKREER